MLQAMARAEPHWPAPVSVTRRSMPASLFDVGLGHRAVRLVRPGRRHALVLVVDARRRIELRLEAPRPVERRGAPQPVGVAHRVGDLHLRIGRDLLADQLHGEDRRQVGGTRRLHRARVERRQRIAGEIGRRLIQWVGIRSSDSVNLTVSAAMGRYYDGHDARGVTHAARGARGPGRDLRARGRGAGLARRRSGSRAARTRPAPRGGAGRDHGLPGGPEAEQGRHRRRGSSR